MRSSIVVLLFLFVQVLSAVVPAAALPVQPLLPTAALFVAGPGDDDEDAVGGPLDCPLVDFVMTHGTPVPEEYEEFVRQWLEDMGYHNSGVYVVGSTIVIITVVSFNECPKVTVL
ncbi:MAG: hypothetical protein JNL08_20005 [Planctomycetes bacterium]|nr:hypothetical protein [Planctomycetota bacterium]